MPDSNIGSLPQVPDLDDGSLMVVEQQGQAMKMTGAQFKDFGRQSVIAEVQGYVDEAQQAAESATGAVQSVAGMTVSAHDLEHGQEATVSKTIVNDVFHLSFGLPEGKQGIPGPEGKEGPRGPRGDTGRGLDILGYYDTIEDLEAAQTSPEAGEAYGVGTEAPYDIYVFDGVTNTWKNNGPLSGGGSIVPENVVTSEGGAAIVVDEALGYAPHVITITDEEEPPLTAGDIEYKEGTVESALEGLFTSVSDGKALVASAITDKGVETPPDATFSQMAENIGAITTGSSTEDATATPGDILAPKTAYVAGGKVEGIIPTLYGRTITPGTADQTIAGGQYLGGTQVIKGDTNLVSANIRKGITLFGVDGAMEQTFLATLTVTVDIGAVVTATNGDVEISALCTTGAVTLELPIEGQWTVTARRGVAQYNSVIVTVSSSYSATLTAELHVEYYGDLGELASSGYPNHSPSAGASLNGNAYIGFGGMNYQGVSFLKTIYKFDSALTKTFSLGGEGDQKRTQVGAAAVGDHVIFAGGYYSVYNAQQIQTSYYSASKVSVFDDNLTYSQAEDLSQKRQKLKGVTVGNLALFGGGDLISNTASPSRTKTAVVDAYDAQLTHTVPTILALPEADIQAASNQNYGIFAGTRVSAYDSGATRTMAANLDGVPTAAARAGNYVLFIGDSVANAFDLFLTRVATQAPDKKRQMGTTVRDYAVFAGGEDIGETISADVYDAFLVRTEAKTPLTAGAVETAYSVYCAASAGNYALFPGAIRETSTLTKRNVIAYQYV